MPTQYELNKCRDFLKVHLALSSGSAVIFTFDDYTDKHVLSLFENAVKEEGAHVGLLHCPSKQSPYHGVPDQYESELLKAGYWFDFTHQAAVHSQICEKFVRRGGSFFLLRGLTWKEAEVLIFNISVADYLVKARELSVLFRGGTRQIKIRSACGTDITAVTAPTKIAFHRVSELMAKKGREIMCYGYSIIPLDFSSLNGCLVVTGYVWPPESIRKVSESICLTIRNGVIEAIEGRVEAVAVKQWLARHNHVGVYRIAHLTLGLIPNLSPCDSLLANERVEGALTFGFGNVWNGESPTHTDMVVLNHEIYLNGKKMELF